MAVVIEFMTGQCGDTSAGIRAWTEPVTVVFHDRVEHHEELSDKDIEFLRKSFSELVDGFCRLRSNYERQE